MALTVHLKLKINGNDIEGESTISSMNREGTIECSSFSYAALKPYRENDFSISDPPQHSPIVIQERIDKSTPLLLKALFQNEPMDWGEFRFYRPALGGSASEEHFYTVLIENGVILAVNQLSEDDLIAGAAALPMMEEVSFGFKNITRTYQIGGVPHTSIVNTG